MNKSEIRIQNNRIRRQRELRRNIFSAIMTICLIVILSCTENVFLSNAKANTDVDAFKYYKSILIESGDTLWSIATEYKCPGTDTGSLVAEIKRMNGLGCDRIIAGNYLIIPYYKEVSRNKV